MSWKGLVHLSKNDATLCAKERDFNVPFKRCSFDWFFWPGCHLGSVGGGGGYKQTSKAISSQSWLHASVSYRLTAIQILSHKRGGKPTMFMSSMGFPQIDWVLRNVVFPSEPLRGQPNPAQSCWGSYSSRHTVATCFATECGKPEFLIGPVQIVLPRLVPNEHDPAQFDPAA